MKSVELRVLKGVELRVLKGVEARRMSVNEWRERTKKRQRRVEDVKKRQGASLKRFENVNQWPTREKSVLKMYGTREKRVPFKSVGDVKQREIARHQTRVSDCRKVSKRHRKKRRKSCSLLLLLRPAANAHSLARGLRCRWCSCTCNRRRPSVSQRRSFALPQGPLWHPAERELDDQGVARAGTRI